MRKEDHEHIAQCCHSLVGLVQKKENEHLLCYAGVPQEWRVKPEDAPPERTFTKDEFDRFIERLVWAINASPGGRMDDEQRTALHADIINVLNSCARTSEPTKLIAERLVGLFDEKMRVEDAPIDFDRFVRRCKGQMG